jgi:hypothetical protein
MKITAENITSTQNQAEKRSGIESKIKKILHSDSNKEKNMTTTFKNSRETKGNNQETKENPWVRRRS